jgi:hypothetical protein
MPDELIQSILQGVPIKRTLTLYIPPQIVGTDDESMVRNICSMAVAGVAVKVAQDLLESHGIEGVVITTG